MVQEQFNEWDNYVFAAGITTKESDTFVYLFMCVFF